MHQFRTWALTITATDTDATNLPFRQSVGIPGLRAAVASSVGVFYIDVTDKSKPLFRRLAFNATTSEVLPRNVTDSINLEGYSFDKCAMEEWNDYIVFTGATNDSIVVNRVVIKNINTLPDFVVDKYPIYDD
jgi:hypothetical protein